ncbi:hypothetical protein ACTMS2_26310 [Micromonospora sp. SD12]|uniref:hypothetical protein n=1 Tax=Micromonospora sp. SD12 TaxID=3452216 RepID=UPI003F8B93DA
MRDNRPAYWGQRQVREALGTARDVAGTSLITAARRPARPGRFFTVHLGFTAPDLASARELAVGYAEALSVLRPEVALGASALSPAEAWQQAERLFCGASGPDGERCADVANHPGFHHAPGPGGLGWGDGD